MHSIDLTTHSTYLTRHYIHLTILSVNLTMLAVLFQINNNQNFKKRELMKHVQ